MLIYLRNSILVLTVATFAPNLADSMHRFRQPLKVDRTPSSDSFRRHKKLESVEQWLSELDSSRRITENGCDRP